jgi:hypothetical protein
VFVELIAAGGMVYYLTRRHYAGRPVGNGIAGTASDIAQDVRNYFSSKTEPNARAVSAQNEIDAIVELLESASAEERKVLLSVLARRQVSKR